MNITPNKCTRKTILLVLCLLGVLFYAKGQTFTEVSQAAGIDFLYESEAFFGGGAAFFDYNNDDWLDIYVVGGKRRDALYHNNGDGTFTNISESAGLAVTDDVVTTGVVTGDIDNDGFQDVFVTTWYKIIEGCCAELDELNGVPQEVFEFKGTTNILLKNNGDGTFQNIASTSGIIDTAYSASASFGDFNLDGYLDIYVANYVKYVRFDEFDEIDHIGYPNFLYINNGNNAFSEVAASFEVNDVGTALAVVATDFDNDNDNDILIANDFGEFVIPNQLFQNNFPENSFDSISISSDANISMYGMGIAIGDYDEDQDLDYYVTNIGQNVLMNNQGDGTFVEQAQIAGVDNTYSTDGLFTTGWGTAFFDFNHDTYLDLVVSNGHIPAANFIQNNITDPDKLYQNNGDGTFEDVGAMFGINNEDINRGLALGDYDNDGDMDMLVVAITNADDDDILTYTDNDHIALYRNDVITNETSQNWLKVALQGTVNNRNAYGARILLKNNGRTFIREIDGGSSHASHHSPIAHFGLGNYNSIDMLKVIWPNGNEQILTNIETNQQIEIVENTAIEYISLNLKAFLEGAYIASTNAMRTDLLINEQLPLTQPYNTIPWNYTGEEALTNQTAFPTNTVDWILVELFNENYTSLAQQAALLLSDGSVKGIENETLTNDINFNAIANENYFIAIRHRNHLDVLTSTAINLSASTVNTYDFTLQATHQKLINNTNNTYALPAGDFNADGVLSYTDFNIYAIMLNINFPYNPADANLDGSVEEEEFNYYLNNVSWIGVDRLRY